MEPTSEHPHTSTPERDELRQSSGNSSLRNALDTDYSRFDVEGGRLPRSRRDEGSAASPTLSLPSPRFIRVCERDPDRRVQRGESLRHHDNSVEKSQEGCACDKRCRSIRSEDGGWNALLERQAPLWNDGRCDAIAAGTRGSSEAPTQEGSRTEAIPADL